MSVTRREVLSSFSAAAALGVLLPKPLSADAGQVQGEALPSAVYPFDKLDVHGGQASQMRPILKGKLVTGEAIEVHETTLPPHGAPHPPHHHEHSEMWFVREGTLEIFIAGETRRIGAGSAAFVRSNEEHGVKNTTDQPVTYFVVAVGPGADK
ncbi:MAG TPA: cupin domain-containing protein [Candidatus Methylomirabilis sp.]|nr:cupin domain-containing protein [Candidatus Methylomirabilis sp.]